MMIAAKGYQPNNPNLHIGRDIYVSSVRVTRLACYKMAPHTISAQGITMQHCQEGRVVLLHTWSDMHHERQAFRQPTGLAFRSITRAQHAPLTGLQCSRSPDLPRIFKLGRDSCHHSQGGDETEPAEDVLDFGVILCDRLEIASC
ncbi:hypothetical protein FIBSPDRAFT_873220 [Athelia psychrophila]|uniref:Uncharacterized protein n=1 Tax=Athelia psychrophila TaxID=1759441 RepID=A0A165YRV5_9AGAM|nr:hypothetical protein FIBSPDRAFT_873220 [Fibularhizoctonia sp. CBS 109695]